MGDDSVSLLQMQEKCQAQAKQIDRLREELNAERRKEVEYANKVGEDPPSCRTIKFQNCFVPQHKQNCYPREASSLFVTVRARIPWCSIDSWRWLSRRQG